MVKRWGRPNSSLLEQYACIEKGVMLLVLAEGVEMDTWAVQRDESFFY
jgi:hypothetical protein